jgi:N-acetylmuramoyl-L-alanine amidase
MNSSIQSEDLPGDARRGVDVSFRDVKQRMAWRLPFVPSGRASGGAKVSAQPGVTALPRSIFFLRAFASVSPVFAVGLLAGSFSVFASAAHTTSASRPRTPNSGAADPTASVKRQSASSQFARAEEQRGSLNNKASEKRTLADYKQVVATYRRVYLITPRASEVPDALFAVAELYTEMGDRFGRTYYQSAVDSYQFLIREYPTSRYCQDAYLRSAKLQRDQLSDLGGASQTYEAFLKRFPRSQHRREVQEARAELALLQNSAPDSPKSAIAKRAGSEAGRYEAPKRVISRDVPREAETEIPSSEGRSGAREAVATANAAGHAPQLRKISAAALQNSTRVTIELENSVQYTSGRIANPDRIYFDLLAAKLTPQLAHSKIKTEGPILSSVRVAQNPAGVVRVVLDVNGVADYTASLLNNPSRLVIDLYSNAQPVQMAKTGDGEADSAAADTVATTAAEKPTGKPQPASTNPVRSTKAATDETPSVIPQPKSKLSTAKIDNSSAKKPDLVKPASAPQPTHDGQSTLTRALGLKIGRIVIDAGHGGHDTGTIGPTGLMEKDLCLDVALRLGKIIQQRLPGADVIFTRSDDTFIPLEERTHIANDVKADMFISIHANSSRDSGARGIETYYLNLKGSDEAMEVAARENATSDQGIHELQDLVKQIARTEKIDESREFAEDVQDQLAKRVQKAAKPVKNRGVRKAPFVVLIGADMPSILTEISFLSNPADEKMLKQPEHRQRVAEGIYQGVASYLQSLNSVGVNQTSPPPKRTSTSAAVESSRNRN